MDLHQLCHENHHRRTADPAGSSAPTQLADAEPPLAAMAPATAEAGPPARTLLQWMDLSKPHFRLVDPPLPTAVPAQPRVPDASVATAVDYARAALTVEI